MVGIVAASDSKSVLIVGHGLTITDVFELSPGLFLQPNVPNLQLDATEKACNSFADYAAVVHGREIATFALRIEHEESSKALVTKAWNALWKFHLLSISCNYPCFSLYSVSDGRRPLFSAANRTPLVQPLPTLHLATTDELLWVRQNASMFDKLIHVPEFGAAMRCYGNAHYLPDLDIRIMLLWAGIEGLLSVDAELSRRLALYATLMFNGSPDEKILYFEEVKKAYAIRSRAVHGAGVKLGKLDAGYRSASRILAGLLARCVELGRVPSPAELDRLAVSPVLH